MSDWNNLLQKLNTRVNSTEPSQKADDSASQLNFLQQNFNLGRSNGTSPEIRSQSNEANVYPREDLSASTKSENILPTAVISYIDDISDLRINNIKNFKPEERQGKTIAVNSRFICYSNESGILTIKSLKNLSLVHPINEINSKVVDLAFFEAPVSNYLAVICANGALFVFSIDLNPSKDKILVKYRLKHSYKQPTEKAQIQWKNEEKIGVVVGQEFTVFDIIPDKPNPEPTEEPPKPVSHNNFEFGVNIRDFAFSPAYPLAYILLENNTVRIISLENVDETKHFTPHETSAGPVLKILAYKSLVRHQAIKSNEEGANDQTFRDIFLTVTQSFEIKVWDLSEWDSENDTYYCIETYQLNQNNDKLDPIPLINRFVFYDPGLNFVFVAFKTNGEKGICITALHIEQFFYGYSESYDSGKKSRKFVNSIQTIWLKKNDLTDISALNFGDDEIDSYFKKNTYVQMSDFEPASTRTQDGSYACNSKSVLVFFVHNEDTISLSKVLGEKLYPFALVEEFDKITQAEQLETQSAISRGEASDSSFPPEIPTFLQEFINENKRSESRKEEDKLVKVFAEPEYGKDIKQVDEAVDVKKGSREPASKDDTNSPDTTKQQPSHKKRHDKKDREAAAEHDQGKHKVVPTKIVSRTDNQKNPPIQAAGLKSLETIEKEMQASKKEEAYSQNIEKTIEKKFQELTDKSLQALANRFNKLEETIESRVNERVSKLQLDSLNNTLSRDIDDRIQREFSNGFEKVVTPCFERYLVKMFEQVCSSFDTGHKYYIEKLNVEQAKGEQLKETMNEVIKSFIHISNALTEGLMNNQNSFSRMENNVQEKQNQISRLVDQMNEILQKQQDVQKKIDSIERDMQDAINQYQSEVEVYRDMANRYLDRLNEFPSGPETKAPEETKKDAQAPGTYPSHPYGFGNAPYYGGKSKEKTPHPLNDQLAYLQGIATGRPMDVSGGPMFRGIGGGVPVMSPASSQMMYAQGYGGGYYDNPYQKAKASYNAFLQNQQAQAQAQAQAPMGQQQQQQGMNPVLNQQNLAPPSTNMPIYNPNLNPHNPTPVTQQTPMGNQTNQLTPELQALYQKLEMFLKQTSGDKEEEKGANLSSPYMPNVLPQDESKKFFGGMNQAQVQSSTPQQGPTSQRSLSQIEPPGHQKMSNISSQNQSFSQDPESAGKPGGQHLPPGMQGTPQSQPNFMQALLQNLPQLQQNLQNQNMNQPKLPQNFPQNFGHNIQGQGATTASSQGQQNPNQLGLNQMGGWGQNMNFQSMFPQNIAQNIAPPPNLGNFGGYQAFPPQMANATINKMSGSKPSSTVDISQIPLVNSMFKTPSRDAMADENNNTAAESNENESE